MKTDKNAVTDSRTVAGVKTFTELGEIMLREAGEKACQDGYGTTDPQWVGCYALDYGDINRNGTLN